MARIKGKDTEPERIVRSVLHRLGYRFRLHDRRLPGTPDIVLRRLKTVVLVHGCFWHRHSKCRFAYKPKSRERFWERKFSDNVARDRRQSRELRRAGWKVVTVWECQTADRASLGSRLQRELSKSEVLEASQE
jgi:DNA mismatch endonuclease (patch repair protein)